MLMELCQRCVSTCLDAGTLRATDASALYASPKHRAWSFWNCGACQPKNVCV